MTADELFDQALGGTMLPPRESTPLEELARTWAPPKVAPAVELAVRMARRGDTDACLAALQEAQRLAYGQDGPVHGCMSCGGHAAWHGALCSSCQQVGWAEVGCPACCCYHLQRPDGYILAGCRWGLDQNDRLPYTPDYGAADEEDMRQQELLDLRES